MPTLCCNVKRSITINMCDVSYLLLPCFYNIIAWTNGFCVVAQNTKTDYSIRQNIVDFTKHIHTGPNGNWKTTMNQTQVGYTSINTD